jgi:hypothetical protein
MMDGKIAEAAAEFKELETELAGQPKPRQPLLNWTTTMLGLSLLFDGKEKEARPVFAQLAARGPFSDKDQDEDMAKFFINVGTAMSGDAVVPASLAKDYDRWTFAGIGPLLYGLKDWNLENMEEATPLLRQFADANPEKMVAWADGPADLKTLQDIAQGCVDDYLEGRPAVQALTTAVSIDQQAEALAKAKAARAKMKLMTKVARELDEKIADIGPKVAAAMADRDKMATDDLASDAKLLPEAKQKRLDLHAKFMFTEAKEAMLNPVLKTEPAKDEQALLAKKSSWLANFKDQLIDDLNAKGYAQPVDTKKGAPTTGPIVKADPQNVMITSPKGPAPIPWADLAPDGVFKLGQSFITADLPPQIMAFRKWHLGVYASFIGKQTESMTLLKEAADLKPLFGEELPVFQTPSNPW